MYLLTNGLHIMNTKLKISVIILSFIGLITISCNSEESTGSDLVKLNFEQKYQTNELTIKFHSVLSDSRCPIGLICFWEGNAEVQFSYINNEGNGSDFILNTHSGFRTDTLINGYRIKLVKVLPYPEKDVIIDKDDYMVELDINKE